MIILWDAKGGIGSGNWGHAGRKGVKGGSAPISNNTPENIYAGGQRYKQAGGKRSVTEKRKVAYKSKNEAANASSTVSDVSLPSPIDTIPVKPQNPNIAFYQSRVDLAVGSSTLTLGTKLYTIKNLKSKIDGIDMSDEEKNILRDIVNKGIKDTLDSDLAVARDLIIENTRKMVDSGFNGHITVNNEIKQWQELYNENQDDWNLDQSDIDYIENGLKAIKSELSASINGDTLYSLSKTTDLGNVKLDGFARHDSNRAKDFLDSVSKRSGAESVHFYEYEGDWMVNDYLRTGSIPNNQSNARFKLEIGYVNDSEWTSTATNGIKNRIKKLDESMIDELTKPTVLTRFVGEGHPAYNAINSGLNALGTVYNEANFASTSANINHTFGGRKVKVRIKAPQGTRGLSFATDYKLRYPDEREFLLPRNSAFKIVGIDTDTSEVFVELIDNGVHP